VAVFDGRSAGFSEYDTHEVIDGRGRYLMAGLIDGHFLIESTMLIIPEFDRAVILRGAIAVVADRHEIIKVIGRNGLRYMLTVREGLPIDIFFAVILRTLDSPGNGAIAPGYVADFIIFDGFINSRVRQVFKAGRKVAEDGQMTVNNPEFFEILPNSMNPAPLHKQDLQISVRGPAVWVIEIIPE